jgi:hypothetical protein
MQEISEPNRDEPKRILSLDGGGLRAFFTLEVLERIEELVQQRLNRQDAVLADYFDLIAGTSTGAIIGAFLSWGRSVSEIKRDYQQLAATVFRPYRNPFRWLVNRYDAAVLSKILRSSFLEGDAQAPREATLGSTALRTVFLAVMRNASTGSAWPLCSHPALKYNDRARRNCNLDIPLWSIVRASAAAPTYFAPEFITAGEKTFQFIDGGLTPYNNPALIAALMVTEPCFGIQWPGGEDRLYVLSVGTGSTHVHYTSARNLWELALPAVVPKTIASLIEGSTLQQDFLCRVIGRCLYGPTIDREVADLVEAPRPEDRRVSQERRFSYVRYNTDFSAPEFVPVLEKYGGDIPMDLRSLIPALQELGRSYALKEVNDEHLR